MRYMNELLLVIMDIIPKYFLIEKAKITIFLHMLSIMLGTQLIFHCGTVRDMD